MELLIVQIILDCLLVMLVGLYSWKYCKDVLRTANCNGKTMIGLFVLGVAFGLDVFTLVYHILKLIIN
ncbi:MAG: hypothetical protein IKP45_03130 [Bacteroidales bacterium]|nr:hypothetical protein [Bacteroidales bacterium]